MYNFRYILRRAWHTYRMEGLRGVIRVANARLVHAKDYDEIQREKSRAYMSWFNKHRAGQKELDSQRSEKFAWQPLMSIVVPTYNVRKEYLQALVQSVIAQTYENWELIFADGASPDRNAKISLKKAEAMDSRIRVLYLDENRGISGNTNEALKAVRGEYIVFSDHDDVLEPDALYWLVKAANEHGAELIYTDEDKVDETGRIFYEPHLKPDWSPETICSCNYVNHLTAVSSKVQKEAGGLRPDFDGSQDHEFVLRVIDKITADKIVHIPRVLYHWRQFNNSMSKQKLEICQAAGRQAVKEHENRLGFDCEVTQAHGYRVIPSQISAGKGISVIVPFLGESVDSGKLQERWKSAGVEHLKEVITARRNGALYECLNQAAREAEGDYLLFAVAEIEPRKPSNAGQVMDPLTELLMYAQQPEVGAVGGRLFMDDGRIFYATDYLVEGIPKLHYCGHDSRQIARGGLERVARNVSALPLGLMMLKKNDFLELGGFNEAYHDSLGEVDLCLRLLKNGKRIIYTPYAEGRLIGTTTGGDSHKSDVELFKSDWPDCYERYYREDVI